MRSAALKVERLLQINMAALAAMGTLLLGMGQRSVYLPVIAAIAAVTSVVFTDTLKWRWLRMHRNVGNLIAIVAVIYAMRDFTRQDSETQLLAIANLLVYLQIVLLHQEKSLRVYWQLAVLSLLQVVVAAALNLGIEFGLLLVLYMFAALTGLLLLFIYRETERFRDGPQATRREQVSMRNLFAQPTQRGRRRPAIAISNAGAHAGDDPAESMMRWAMVSEVMLMGMVTLGVATLVFFSVPRYKSRAWQGPLAQQQQIVGFAQEVTLGDVGKIQLSDELAMRVSFRDAQTGEPLSLSSDPYFRGAVLSRYVRYEGKAGRWTQGGQPTGQRKIGPPPSGKDLVVQDILLQPSHGRHVQGQPDSRVLFSVSPAYRSEGSPDGILVVPFTHQLTGGDRQSARGEYRYELATDAIRDGHQAVITPHGSYRLSSQQLRHHTSMPAGNEDPDAGEQGGDPLANLRRIAGEVIARGNFAPDNVVARARALEAHFHEPGRYTYSLDDDPLRRNHDLDPIEDFVLNHRQGHCEYFASALVLMLRSQGIPARMVVGYHGGDFNTVGNFYQVRQLHAHAWAEAYLEPDQVPAYLRADPEENFGGGGWLRLEPTPADITEANPTTAMTVLAKIGELVDYANLLWNDYVLGLNSERQQESIYRPLADRLTETVRGAFSLEAWQQFFLAGIRWMGWDSAAFFSGSWFNWRAGLVTFAVLLIAVGLWRLLAPHAPPLVRWWRRLRGVGTGSPQAVKRRVEFYRRLEVILARRGWRRPAHTTPQEFAVQAGQLLADLPGGASLSSLPARIVAAFYRVRFGGEALDNFEAEAVEQDLSRLEQALQTPPSRNPSPRPPGPASPG